MSRVLVTGATGFVGRHAIPALIERGHEVHAVSSGDARPDRHESAAWHHADLLEPDGIQGVMEAVRPTHLLHLAWYAEHGLFWSSPENVRWVEASLRLLRTFAGHGGARAVLAGTCAEYDWRYGYCSEGVTPLKPATLYGRAKHAFHLTAEGFALQAGMSLGWGRIFFLYGPHEGRDRLVSSVIRALVAGQPAPTSAGAQVRDFMHVEDVGRAFVELLDSDAEGAVNVASGQPVAIREVVEKVGQLVGRPDLLRVGEMETRSGDPPLLLADVRRLNEQVGFKPRFGLEAGIEQTIEWWRGQTTSSR